VTLFCDTTAEEFTVDLVGNSIERPSVAAQLVFDQSGSMLEVTEEGRTKEEVLEDAARAFTDLLYDDNGVGLNTYDHDAYPVLDVQEAGGWGARGRAGTRCTTRYGRSRRTSTGRPRSGTASNSPATASPPPPTSTNTRWW
jgi:hypothetical protein